MHVIWNHSPTCVIFYCISGNSYPSSSLTAIWQLWQNISFALQSLFPFLHSCCVFIQHQNYALCPQMTCWVIQLRMWYLGEVHVSYRMYMWLLSVTSTKKRLSSNHLRCKVHYADILNGINIFLCINALINRATLKLFSYHKYRTTDAISLMWATIDRKTFAVNKLWHNENTNRVCI